MRFASSSWCSSSRPAEECQCIRILISSLYLFFFLFLEFQLFFDVLAVRFDRLDRDAQLLGDLACAHAVAEQLEQGVVIRPGVAQSLGL